MNNVLILLDNPVNVTQIYKDVELISLKNIEQIIKAEITENPECGGKTKGNRKDSCFRQTAKMSCTGRKYRKGNKKL